VNIILFTRGPVTYDHRLRRIGHPVRSAIHKPQIGGLVVGWVTTSEYPLLYVFCSFFFFFLALAFIIVRIVSVTTLPPSLTIVGFAFATLT
jgi:hypothetical protein